MMHEAEGHFTILRRRRVEGETGYSRSSLYALIKQGLWPKPVSIGLRSVGWPAHEVAALNRARIAGESEQAIRVLVQQLEAERRANHRPRPSPEAA
jgi:prophage regulatory protein